MRTLLWIKLLGLIIAMELIFGGWQQVQASSKNNEHSGALVIRPAQSGVSKPALWITQHSKELAPLMSETERQLHEKLMRILPLPVPREKLHSNYKPSSTMLSTRVPLALSLKSAIMAPPPRGTFEGLNNYDNILGGLGFQPVPPDVNGDVGPNHYVEIVNTVIRVYDKKGNPLSAPFPLSALFASAGFSGPCATNNDGDVIVLYDQFADRWFLSQFYIQDAWNNTGPSHHCIAISKTGDPLGGYYLYDFVWPDFPASSGTHILMDYPHHAIWPNAYWMTAHEFDFKGTQCPSGYCAQAVVALERNKMLVGDPTARMIYFGKMASPPSGVDMTRIGGVLAADIEGPTPIPNIAGQPAPGIFLEWIADEYGAPADAINVYKFIVDWANPAASDFILYKTIPVAPFNPLNPPDENDIPQPGVSTSSYLDSLSDRFMHRVVIRNMGSYSLIGANHTVCAPELSNTQCQTVGQYQAAIRWYILNYDNNTGDVTLADQGTYTGNPPDTYSRWMGSVTFDKYGDFCVSYTVSSATIYPSIRYACRTPTDPSGTLGSEAELQSGSASQTDTSGRWGDYSMISIDPVDDCTFWPIHEYYTTTNPAGCSSSTCWHTRFGFFRLIYKLSINTTSINGNVTSNPAGINCGSSGSMCSANFTYGSTVTLTATPSTGYIFAGWTDDCSGCGTNTTCTINIDTDKTCSANFIASNSGGSSGGGFGLGSGTGSGSGSTSGGGGGGCSMTGPVSIAGWWNIFAWLLVPIFVLARRIRRMK